MFHDGRLLDSSCCIIFTFCLFVIRASNETEQWFLCDQWPKVGQPGGRGCVRAASSVCPGAHGAHWSTFVQIGAHLNGAVTGPRRQEYR